MRREMHRYSTTPKAALRVGIVSALVLSVGTLLLLVDYGIAARRAPVEKERIEALESLTKEDPGSSKSLHDERERQTEASLARKARSRSIAWVLLVAGGLLVGSGKRIMSRRPVAEPEFGELVAQRFAAPPVAGGGRSLAPRPAPPASAGGQDLGFVDDLVARLGRGREAAIPILQAIQTHYRHLPDEALRRVCDLTEITPAQIAGTSSFYSQFRRSPVGRYVVRVCHGTACHVAGAEQITQELRRSLEIPAGEDTDSKRLFTVDAVACVGCCSLAPVMMVEEEALGRLTPASARHALDALAEEA